MSQVQQSDLTNRYVIIRSKNAACFAGLLKSCDLVSATVVLAAARRLWYWDGAASLSELAVRGTSKPENCKFTVPVPEQLILSVVEIIFCSPQAKDSIEGVKEWSAHG